MIFFILILGSVYNSQAFTVGPVGSYMSTPEPCRKQLSRSVSVTIAPARVQRTCLSALLDVPDHYFATTLFLTGILISISRQLVRSRLEERAWEQRLEAAREERLRRDPTVTELDLIRKEASASWSMYGKSRQHREEEKWVGEGGGLHDNRQGGGQVMDRTQESDDTESTTTRRTSRSSKQRHRMTKEEINDFELEHGIDYDPYYDDPYTEDELPSDVKYNVDKRYGDRIYENGEIFYKDASSGFFYRQGCKPRKNNFWGR